MLIVKSAFSNPFSVYYLWLLKTLLCESVYNVCDDVKYYLVIGKSFCPFLTAIRGHYAIVLLLLLSKGDSGLGQIH